MEKLKQALKTLGVQGTVITKQHDRWTQNVYVNGVWFLLGDTVLNVFIE